MIYLVLFLATLAQPLATVQGTVSWENTGDPVVGATVHLVELERRATTGDAGAFTFRDVEAGRWTLRVEGAGFTPVRVTVLVPDEGTVDLDVLVSDRPTRVTEFAFLIGRVTDAVEGEPVPRAEVRSEDGGGTATDRHGVFVLRIPADDTVGVRVWAYGYETVELRVRPSDVRDTLFVRLPIRPVNIDALSVRAGPLGEAAVARELFEREPRPGVVGISRREIEEVPVMLMKDVVRSLQALPGIVQINDLSARLHVRGGGPDQNLFLLDGARVFAPYHMFGIYGAFNPEATSRVELYRGDVPARNGGALSAVVDVVQRHRADRPVEGGASLGMLSMGATARGQLPGVTGSWMVAGRRSTATNAVVGDLWWSRDRPFPFRFHDVQARVGLQPAQAHRVSGSWFSSSDDFTMFLETESGAMASSWANRVGSFRWDWDIAGGWSTRLAAWRSEYDMSLLVGSGENRPEVGNDVAMTGYRLEGVRQGGTGLRMGLEVLAGDVGIQGSDRKGGYVDGSLASPYSAVGAYVEVEHAFGPVRLAPGLRLERFGNREDWRLAPRLAARLEIGERTAITLGASRTHQDLSTLRDDRFVLPGPPFWFVHPDSAPVSMADGVSAAVEGWWAREWSYSIGAYRRWFTDLPVWRPVGDRRVRDLEWHEGNARGIELVLRRHAEGLNGWISYGYSRVSFVEPGGREYSPAWDRRHSVDVAVSMDLGRFRIGTRAVYGTGTPFWPQSGMLVARWFGPDRGNIENRGTYPIWSDQQMRYPDYFRVDATARMNLTLWGMRLTPYVGLLNALGRANVLYYETVRYGRTVALRPNSRVALTHLPSVGLEVEF